MAGPASSRLAPQAAPPEPPEHVETDAATRIQEDLDKLLLACFNALLGVSKATAGGGGAGARPGGEAAASTGVAIGRMLRELGEAIDALPVLPLPEEQGVTSVETARRRLKALEGQYKLIHQELKGVVEDAGVLSARLRKAVSSSSGEGDALVE